MAPRQHEHLEPPTHRFYHGALLTRNRLTHTAGPPDPPQTPPPIRCSGPADTDAPMPSRSGPTSCPESGVWSLRWSSEANSQPEHDARCTNPRATKAAPTQRLFQLIAHSRHALLRSRMWASRRSAIGSRCPGRHRAIRWVASQDWGMVARVCSPHAIAEGSGRARQRSSGSAPMTRYT